MSSPIPFWNTNLPPSQHTPACPPYLTYAYDNPKDRAVLATPDAAFERQSWPDVCALIRERRLGDFRRVPSELRRYRRWCAVLEERESGGVRGFVVRERLGWNMNDDLSNARTQEDDDDEGKWFTKKDSFKILRNDWPYGLDARIVHLVVWTKWLFPTDPHDPDGDLTASAREAIDAFVRRTFGSVCGEENVRWFWNWRGLKSVLAVEHFHVLIYEPPEGFVERVTGGDVAMSEREGVVGV